MRVRLDREEVDYQVLRSNEQWSDHMLRTFVTAGVITWLRPQRAIDPACGDGSILLSANEQRAIEMALLGDISAPNIESVEQHLPPGWSVVNDDALLMLQVQPDMSFDVVVLTEILEHLIDPSTLLREARRVGRFLVASSPEMRPGQIDRNPEHVWMFDELGYKELLVEAGWEPGPKVDIRLPSEYDFQIWSAK